MNFVLIFLAILPGIIFLIFIYKIDRFNREPIGLLAKLFFVGIAAIAPAIVLEQIFLGMNLFQGYLGLAIEAFLIIGLTEEYLKRLAVKIVAYRSDEYDERLDGIVYCVVASLGFATLENVMYVIQYAQEMPYLWITRALLAVPAHMLFGITMGYYLSMSKFCNNPSLAKKYASLSLWVPVFFHGLYDFFALSGSFLFLVFLIVLMIVMWVYNIKRLKIYVKESKVKKELTDKMME